MESVTGDRAERRLAAIVAVDVVGYSRLMEADEAGTLAALQERRRSILAPTIAAAGGSSNSSGYHGGHHTNHYRPHVYYGWSHGPQYQTTYYGNPVPWSSGWYRYCSAKYRSFNPSTGHFVGYDGRHHFCR